MSITPLSAQAYFDALPDDRREPLVRIRQMIKRVWIHVKEDMHFGVPTYHLEGRPFCSMASQKNYMALYVVPHDLLNAFKNELRTQNTGRSCVRFRKITEEQFDLCEHIIKYTGMRFAESIHYAHAESKIVRHAEAV